MTFEEAAAQRQRIGRKIIETSQVCSEGYIQAISQFDSDADKESNRKCAIAASNTGIFILGALGYTEDEKRQLIAEYKRS